MSKRYSWRCCHRSKRLHHTPLYLPAWSTVPRKRLPTNKVIVCIGICGWGSHTYHWFSRVPVALKRKRGRPNKQQIAPTPVGPRILRSQIRKVQTASMEQVLQTASNADSTTETRMDGLAETSLEGPAETSLEGPAETPTLPAV